MEDGVGELNLAQSALVEMMFHNFSKFGVLEQWMCGGSCTQNMLNMCAEHSLHAWCSVFVGQAAWHSEHVTLWGVDGQPNDVSLGCNDATLSGGVMLSYILLSEYAIGIHSCWCEFLKTSPRYFQVWVQAWENSMRLCWLEYFPLEYLRPGSWWIPG